MRPALVVAVVLALAALVLTTGWAALRPAAVERDRRPARSCSATCGRRHGPRLERGHVHLRHLREELGAQRIKTVRRMGYRLVEDAGAG